AIRQFTVRRTRRQLDEIARAHPEEYRIGDRSARYPKHRAQYFDCRSKPEDDRIADEIHALASRLHGVARLGERLKAPKWLPEEQYLRRVVASARALARYHVMASLRSSRVALYEHAVGADRAWKHFLGEAPRKGKRDDAGNFVERSLERADRPPRWKLSIRPPDEFAWLLDPREFARRAEEDAVTYERIAELTTQLSDSRERSKLDHLERCCDEAGLVIAFDSYLVSLRYLEAKLRERGVYVEVLTGELGLAGKRRAVQQLGRETNVSRLVALCTDAFSEGLNLQGASCVVHLDTPTVVRVAEQRAGRVDRDGQPTRRGRHLVAAGRARLRPARSGHLSRAPPGSAGPDRRQRDPPRGHRGGHPLQRQGAGRKAPLTPSRSSISTGSPNDSVHGSPPIRRAG